MEAQSRLHVVVNRCLVALHHIFICVTASVVQLLNSFLAQVPIHFQVGKRSPCLARSLGCLHDQTEQLDSPERRQAISIQLGKNILLGETNFSFYLKIAYKFEHLLVLQRHRRPELRHSPPRYLVRRKEKYSWEKTQPNFPNFPTTKKLELKIQKSIFQPSRLTSAAEKQKPCYKTFPR